MAKRILSIVTLREFNHAGIRETLNVGLYQGPHKALFEMGGMAYRYAAVHSASIEYDYSDYNRATIKANGVVVAIFQINDIEVQ